jgi:hypothetical protein
LRLADRTVAKDRKMPHDEPVILVLTPEQRQIVHRVSGQHVEAIELMPNEPVHDNGTLRAHWRLSAATGIPRQKWMSDEDPDAAPTTSEAS